MVNLVLALGLVILTGCGQVADMEVYQDGGCRVTSYDRLAHVQHLRTEDGDTVRCTLEFKKR